MAKKKKTSYEEWLKQNDSGVVRTADAVVTTMRGVQNAVQNATQRSRLNKYNTPGFNPYENYSTAVQYGKDLQSMYDSYKGQNLLVNSLKAGQNPLDAYRQESRLKNAITRHNTYMDGIADEAAFNEQIAYPMRYQGLTSAAGVNARLKGMQQTISGFRQSGQTEKANAMQAEYDWLSQRQYDYWTEDDYKKNIAYLEGEIGKQEDRMSNGGQFVRTPFGFVAVNEYAGTDLTEDEYRNLQQQQASNARELSRLENLKTQLSNLQATKEQNAYRDVMKDWSEQDFARMEELARLVGKSSDVRNSGNAAQLMTPGANNPWLSVRTNEEANADNPRIKELNDYFRKKGYSDEEIAALTNYFLREQHAIENERLVKDLTEWSGKNIGTKALGAAMSVPLSLASGIGYADIALQNATAKTDPFTGGRQRVDPYSPLTAISDASYALREGMSKNFGKTGKTIYNAFMSFVDSQAAMMTGGWLGEALLGGSAALSMTRDAYARGATDMQALAEGFFAGLAEAAFEHISLDKLRIMKTGSAAARKTAKEFAVDLLKQMGVEASEEGATDIANLITDYIIMGDKSEINASIRDLMANDPNMSEEEAEKQAWAKWFGQLGEDMIAGALSGGFGTVANTGIGTFQRNAGYVSEGRKILDAGNASTLKELGAALPEGSYGRGLAENVNADGTGIKTARQLGAIASELNQNTLRQGVQSRLEQLGVANASETATAIMRELNGQTTTKAQDQLLKSKAAQRVLTEFRSAAEGSTNYTNEWAYDALYENAERGRNLRTNDEAVKEVAEFAKDYGRHEEAVNKLFKLNSDIPVESFKTGFDAAYTMGKNGVDMEQAMTATATQRMSETQRALAWEIGRSAANNTTTEEGVKVDGEEGSISVPGGGERYDGARAEESVGKLAEGAEPAKGDGQVLSRSAKDSGAADLAYEVNPVSTADFGIAGGTQNKSIYRVSENQKLTPAVQSAVDTAKANGRNIVLFGGGNLEVRDGDAIASVRGLYDPNTNTMYVRVDHERYTAEQIAKHENGHGLIAEGRITVKEVQERMLEEMDENAVKDALADYADAYEGINISDEDLWHEIICDALGSMNIFEGIDVFSEQAERAERRASVIQQSVEEQKNERAPPKSKTEESEAKFSRELDTFTNKDDVDAEISHLKDQIRDIQNAQYAARDQAKSDPRVVEAQKRMWAAEDEKGYSGSFKERVEYRRILNKVKAEMETDIPEGDLNELAKRVKDLEELREQFLKVTPITNAQYQKLVDHFGTTEDYGVAGFILRDGRMLDFSGKKQYGSAYAGGREIYHNEIGDVLKLQSDTSPRINMVSNGNIRLVPEINGINLSQTPTAEQAKALRGFIENYNGSVHVDIDNAAGRTVETFGYRKGTSASKILSDINSYFKTGASPAPQSELLSFYTENNRYSRDLSALDSDYMAAVDNGDMETAQRMVEQAAQRWGAYSKNGKTPVVLYHGTDSNFTEFKSGKIGKRGKPFYGRGFYFSDKKSDAENYGSKIMPVYVRFDNPLILSGDDWAYSLGLAEKSKKKVIKTSVEEARKGFYTLHYVLEDQPDKWLYLDNVTKQQISNDGGKSYVEYKINQISVLPRDVSNLSELARSRGFDAIIGEGTNVGDIGDEYVVFEPEQIKSADPITYDDDGNVIPLSERFNPENADIRFSRELTFEEINPREITPVNNIADNKLVDYLTSEFEKSGWQGRPIVVANMGNEYRAITGSHRIAAAIRAGIDAHAVVIDDESAANELLNAHGDEERAITARELEEDGFITKDVADLIVREDDLNYENYGVPYSDQKRFSRDLSALDSDYMAAVENGDMKTAQRMVDEAAKKWGAYSANSDSPIHFYHGTHGRFYVFEKARQGQNYGGDSRLGKGFYFAHTKTSAKEWARGGNRIVDAYLQMRRPLDLRNSTPDDIAKEINKKYQQKQNEYEDWFPISKEQYKENLDRLRAYDLEHPGSFIDSFKYDKSGKMTDGIREFLSSLGYDGIVSEDEVVVFDSEQIKSADPVTYDDNGNVIPLSERFNPENADIRYSRDLENLDELRRENDRLRKRLDEAKQQTKLTTEPTLREGDVRKAARGMLKEMDSTLTVDDIADDMKALGEYMMRGEGKNERAPSWEEVKRRASEIAERIVDNASALSEASDVELYKDLREYLRTTKLTLAEADRADMQDGYAEFAKRNFNRIKLGNDGLPVDSAYQELQEMYGKGLFPDDITHPADQLMHIEDVLNGLRPVYENPHSFHRQEAVAWAANAVIDTLLSEDVRQTAPTFADKAEARRAADVAKERNKADERVAAERERADKRRAEYMKRSRAAMERLREQRDRKIEKLKQSFRESKVRDRERREENAAKAKYIKRVREKAMKLGDWLLKNSDKEHIPEPLKNGVAEFLTSINPLSEKTLKGETAKKDARFIKRMEALHDLLKKKKQSQDGEDVETFGGYLDLPKGYMEMFDNYLKNARDILDGTDVDTSTPLAYMSSEQLRDLDFLISTLMHSIRQMNTLTENGRFHTAIEAAHNTWDSLRGMVEYSLKRDSAKRFLQWDNTTPFYAFRRFGEGGRAVFEGLQEGWDRFAFNVSDVLDFSKKTYTDAEVKAWSKKVNAFTLENGNKIRMTTAQIMSLYELIKRDQALGHINGGGIRIADIEQGKDKVQQSEHYHFTMDDISKIVGTLTERQRNVADSLQKYMQEQGGKWGNEVSMKRFNYEAFGEEHYFPIATEGNRNTDDPEAKANDLYRLLNMSATKSLTPHANNALVVSDIFDVFADHMSDMAKYNALALPILDVLKWKNYREKVPAGDDSSNFTEYSTDREIRRAYGNGAGSWLMAFLKDMNGAQESSGRGEGLARKMISNYKVAAVAANLRVALLQPTAYVRAAYVLNPKYLAASAAVSAVSLRRSAQECEKHSGIARWKGLGFYDTNISRGIREQIHDGGGVKDKIQEKSMIFAELGDKLTWGVIWNACKLEQKAKGLSGEKLMEATAKRFREVVYATQVVDSTMTRSHTMRGKSLYSGMATAFMAEPTLSYNMLLDAYMDYDADKRKTDRSTAWRKNSGKIAKALGVYCVSAAAAAIVESLADAWRDDDEYETYLQKFLEAMFGGEPTLKGILSGNLVNNLNIFAKLPLVKDLFSRLQGFGTERIDTAAFDDLVKAGEILYEMYQLSTGKIDKPTKVTYYGNMTAYGAIYQTLKALSRLTGLPVSNLSREVTGLWNNTIGRFTPSKKITTYEPKEESQIKKAVTEGWLSEEEATKLLVQKGIADNENDAYFTIRKWKTDEGKTDKLTDLLAAGDKKGFNKEAKNLLDHGVDEKDVTGAAKNKVKDLYLGHDSNGNPTGVARLSKSDAISMLQEYAGMSKEDASQAVMKWTCEVVNGFKYEDIKDQYLDGNITLERANEMRELYGGKPLDDDQLRDWKFEKEVGFSYNDIGDKLMDGEISERKAKQYWMDYGGMSQEDADDKVLKVTFRSEYPDLTYGDDELTLKRMKAYEAYGEAEDIPAQDYIGYMIHIDSLRADKDANGNSISGSKMKKVAEYIDSLPLDPDQKTAVFRSYFTDGEISKNGLKLITW